MLLGGPPAGERLELLEPTYCAVRFTQGGALGYLSHATTPHYVCRLPGLRR